MTEAEDEAHRYPACPHIEDHRLQDIADAWAEYTDAVKDERMAQQEWLEIMRLLDGLTEEDSDV